VVGAERRSNPSCRRRWDECPRQIGNGARRLSRGECACRYSSSEYIGGHGQARMESEEGTAFESLPRRDLCNSVGLDGRSGVHSRMNSSMTPLSSNAVCEPLDFKVE